MTEEQIAALTIDEIVQLCVRLLQEIELRYMAACTPE